MQHAQALGANAVLGVRFDSSEMASVQSTVKAGRHSCVSGLAR